MKLKSVSHSTEPLATATCELFGAQVFKGSELWSPPSRFQGREELFVLESLLAAFNILGSLFFVLSAIGAYIVPLTGPSIYPEIANLGTLVGAIFFFLPQFLGYQLSSRFTVLNDCGPGSLRS